MSLWEISQAIEPFMVGVVVGLICGVGISAVVVTVVFSFGRGGRRA